MDIFLGLTGTGFKGLGVRVWVGITQFLGSCIPPVAPGSGKSSQGRQAWEILAYPCRKYLCIFKTKFSNPPTLPDYRFPPVFLWYCIGGTVNPGYRVSQTSFFPAWCLRNKVCKMTSSSTGVIGKGNPLLNPSCLEHRIFQACLSHRDRAAGTARSSVACGIRCHYQSKEGCSTGWGNQGAPETYVVLLQKYESSRSSKLCWHGCCLSSAHPSDYSCLCC